MKFSLVFTFFRSLSLAHLERSLFSLSKQTAAPSEVVFYDNDTDFSSDETGDLCGRYLSCNWNVRVKIDKHGDPSKRNASYCQNRAIQMATNDTFIFTKADCIYTEDFCEKLLAQKTRNPMEFVAAWMYQLPYWSQKGKPHDQVDHASDLEGLNWRSNIRNLDKNTDGGQLHNHAWMDAASFCTTKQAMERAGWYDPDLRGWSLWQLDLQSNMHKRGVTVKVIEEVLSYHMMHGLSPEEGERDLKKAHEIYNASPRRKDPNFQ